MAQALVPLKDLVAAKSRLAGLLQQEERHALVRAMAEDVLSVLATHSHIQRVTLVSDDPEAQALASALGVNCWSEQSLGCRGLNNLVSAASERLLELSDQPLLVLHADLPLLDATDITEVLQVRSQAQGLVICCDSAGTGTNLLAFDADSLPRFHFGPGSCSLHLGWARDAGKPVEIVRRSGTGLDVDTGEDLLALIRALPATASGSTASLLADGIIAGKIERAMTTTAAFIHSN